MQQIDENDSTFGPLKFGVAYHLEPGIPRKNWLSPSLGINYLGKVTSSFLLICAQTTPGLVLR